MSLLVHLIERIPEHYDEQEMEFGRTYRWCPKCVVLECESCGKNTTLRRTELIKDGHDCECGRDNANRIREEVIIRLLDEEYEPHHHPWRYWHPSENTGLPY